jgi:hypothetical protein
MTSTTPTRGKKRQCKSAGCRVAVFGKDQLCDTCRGKKLSCRRCGNPHGGPPATTKYCPPCRAWRRRRHTLKNKPFTNADDKIIRDIYRRNNARQAGIELRERFPGRPRWSITRRAQMLGAVTVRTKEPPWTAEEDKLLGELAWMLPERIVVIFRKRGFQRTLTAISIRRKRQRLRATIDGMSAQALANLLDKDVKAITRWIADGDLAAERAGVTGDNHDPFHITTAQIRAFLLRFPERIELGRLERVGSKMWFLEMVTGGRITESGAPALGVPSAPERTVSLCGERVTLSALADISGRSVGALLARLDNEGRSVDDAAFGPEGMAADDGPCCAAAAVALRKLMAKHRARAEHLAGWTKLPLGVVERCLRGAVPLQAPAMQRVVEALDAEMTVTILPKRRSFDR